ncbi:hypothetical protein O0L34_g2357 [Tuta absoluta]|nr:hypothetical protein O0L34_g2357 [Tuta absoluta]
MKKNVVAPRKDVKWIKHENMLPVSDDVRRILAGKRADKVVAWFDSCSALAPKVYPVIAKLSRQLKIKYGIAIHRFGKYSGNDCNSDETKDSCNQMLRKDFHFYLAFEEQIADDFVSDNVLRAFNNSVIPIVLGGANYTRFLPEGSYIDSFDYDTSSLAKKIHEVLIDFDKYVEYFKWTNHYTFHRETEDPQTDHLCKVCEMLNDEEQPTKIHYDFTSWWGESVTRLRKKSKPVITVMKNLPYKEPNTFVKFIGKTARVISMVVKEIVSDVKRLWKKLTSW